MTGIEVLNIKASDLGKWSAASVDASAASNDHDGGGCGIFGGSVKEAEPDGPSTGSNMKGKGGSDKNCSSGCATSPSSPLQCVWPLWLAVNRRHHRTVKLLLGLSMSSEGDDADAIDALACARGRAAFAQAQATMAGINTSTGAGAGAAVSRGIVVGVDPNIQHVPSGVHLCACA